jgi:inosose dehydratase
MGSMSDLSRAACITGDAEDMQQVKANRARDHIRSNASSVVSRRAVLFTGAAALVSASNEPRSRMSVEGYIWQQYASRQKKSLAQVLDEVIPMARKAGFHNVELNQEYFAPALRGPTLQLVRANGLSMPSVYVGGMHDAKRADETIARALDIAGICQPFGCTAVVHNPDPKPNHAEKSDAELSVQSQSLNRMGRALSDKGFQLRVHNHTPEMVNHAREWRHTLHNTDPKYVTLCLDLDWVHQGGQDALALLREAGSRVTEVHVRNSRNMLWLEAVEDGDVDYRQIAGYFNKSGLKPLIVVELAYRENTPVTRSLEEDLRRSRVYTEQVFGIKA